MYCIYVELDLLTVRSQIYLSVFVNFIFVIICDEKMFFASVMDNFLSVSDGLSAYATK
jgi:hypothetical protein